jgi:hypothetical protein
MATLVACHHEPITPVVDNNQPDLTGVPCGTDSVYFQNQILPLLVSQCAMSDCHNAQFHTVGIDVTTYDNVRKLLVPGNAAASYLYSTISTSEPADRMPIFPLSAWTPDQVALLKKWIDQGALNNGCNEGYGVCDTTHITYTNFIQPLIARQCQGCHIQSDWGGGIVLNTYTDVKTAALNGRLYGSVAWQAGHYPMPKFGKQLPACFVRKVEAWIKAGMPQ